MTDQIKNSLKKLSGFNCISKSISHEYFDFDLHKEKGKNIHISIHL